MIGFNTLLLDASVDPAHVKLARHQNTKYPGRPTPYELWRTSKEQLELYQRVQRRPVFDGAQMVATFVVTPFDETLFVGLYAVRGVAKAPPGSIDPISGVDVSGLISYDLLPTDSLAEYSGRVVIEWGEGYRTWVQLAGRRDKPIIELRRTAQEPPFPGFAGFCVRLSELGGVPPSWRTALSAVSGIYLLVAPETGRQYVGSAYGAGGFWSRWADYVASGHGGNRRMIDVPSGDYQVSILEVASSTTSPESLIEMEGRWKRKLMTRAHGLNAN